MKDRRLLDRLKALENEYEGQFSIKASRLDADETFARDENEVLPTASAFKLCVLCEWFRQQNRLWPVLGRGRRRAIQGLGVLNLSLLQSVGFSGVTFS